MTEHNLEWDSLLMPCSLKGDSAQAILLDEMVFDDAQCDGELAYHPFGELWTGGAGSTEQLQEGQGASSPHACSSAALGHPTLAAGLAGSSPCSPNHKPAAKQVEVPPPVAEVSRACSLVRPYNEVARCAPSSNTTCPTAEPVPDSHSPRQYVHPPVASPRTYWGPVTTGGQSVQLGNGLTATAAAPGMSAQEALLLPSMPSGPYLSKVPDSTDRQLQSIMRQLEMSSSSTLADPEMFTLSRHGSMLTTPATSEHSSTDTHFLSGMFLVCAAPKPSPCPVLNSPSATAAATPSSFNRAASVSGPMASLAQQHSLEHQLSLPVPQQLQPPVPAAPAAGTALRRNAMTLPVPPAAPVPAVGAMAMRAGMVDVPPQPTDIKKRAAGNEGLDMAAAKRKPGRQAAGVPPGLAAPQAPGSTVAPRARKTPKRHSCHNCGVHSTPQWRCGPDGPRTLCNACGVRYKKGLPLRSYPYKDAQGLAARAPAVPTQLELAPSAAQPASPGMAQAAAPLVPCAAAQARPAHAAPELQQLTVPSQQLQLMLPPQQPQLALRGQSGVTCPTIFAVGSSLPATGYCF